MKKYLLKAAFVALFTGVAPAAVTLGPYGSTWDGTESIQFGRIYRDGTASTGEPNKSYPGILSEGSQYLFKTYTFFNTGAEEIVQVDALLNDFDTHVSAFSGTIYATAFSDNAAAYLGDLGSSSTGSFRFSVPSNSYFMVVTSKNNGTSTGSSHSFTVTGDSIAEVSAIPEPSGLLTLSGLLAGFLSIRSRRRSGGLTSQII